MSKRRQPFLAKIGRVKKHVWYLVASVLSFSGTYLLLLVFAPHLPIGPSSEVLQKKAEASKASVNQLYIPKIGVDIAIVEGNNEVVLEKGAWHRKPQNGDPEKGGNFVLSAHRFEIGWTPGQTVRKSPFYHIDKLKEGDKIYVDYNQKRYTYEVVKKFKVDRYAVEIEAPSKEAKLTLYSCDLAGEQAGREVIEARPIAVKSV